MNLFKHFIFTRFNLGYSDHYFVENPNEWHKNRLDIFYKYTYYSLVNQSIKDFVWVVFFDINTSQSFISEFISRDVEGVLRVKITTLALVESVSKEMINEFEDDFIVSVSTTLDSDDFLLKEFVKEIQDVVKNQMIKPPYCINVNKGFIVDINSGVFHRKIFFKNPFISLVELKGKAKGVFCLPHHVLGERNKIFSIESKFLWIQNIHGSNLLNEIKGTPIIFLPKSLDDIREVYPYPSLDNYLQFFLNYFKKKIKNLFVKISRLFNYGN